MFTIATIYPLSSVEETSLDFNIPDNLHDVVESLNESITHSPILSFS
jgi:hypothetical protein